MQFTMLMHYETSDLTNTVIDQLSGVTPLVVFDDGSSEPFKIDSRCARRDISIIRAKTNRGYVHAVNVGMDILAALEPKVSPSEFYVWVLNTDIRRGLSKGMLEDLATALSEDPHLAAVSPAVLINAHRQMLPGRETLRYATHIDWVAPLVRLSAWKAVGGFDENLRGFGCDLDFTYRARKLGWRFALRPRRWIDHEMMGTVSRVKNANGHADLNYMSQYLCQKHGVKEVWQLKD